MVAGQTANVAVHSGSYGIGVSRLVGGISLTCHDDDGIISGGCTFPCRAD